MNGERIVFLGDSITDEGTFIAFLDAYLLQHARDRNFTLINLGVSSETVSGLSETGHPFPRPCVHDRLERALQESRPDWVVMGYGMNDGIYAPFSAARFQAYREGVHQAIGQIKEIGAKAILMTPPPFDPESFMGNVLLPDDRPDYSYESPYYRYNEVLRRYADWLLSPDAGTDETVDIFGPLQNVMEEARKKRPDYRSGDGIHPNAAGHWIIAKALLSRLFGITVPGTPDYVNRPEESPLFQLVLQRHRLLGSTWKEHVGHTNPNKAKALPLQRALIRGEETTSQIRILL